MIDIQYLGDRTAMIESIYYEWTESFTKHNVLVARDRWK